MLAIQYGIAEQAEQQQKLIKQFKGCLLSENLYHLLVQYIKTNKVRVPECSRLMEMSETFQDGARQDRRALQSKFKSWAKRMYVRDGDNVLMLAQTNKMIVPKEHHTVIIMNAHLGTGENRDSAAHYSVDKVVEMLKQHYSWGRRDFGLDWDIVVAVISTCPNKKCLSHLQRRFSPKSPPSKKFKSYSDSAQDSTLQLTPTTSKEPQLRPLNTLIQEIKSMRSQENLVPKVLPTTGRLMQMTPYPARRYGVNSCNSNAATQNSVYKNTAMLEEYYFIRQQQEMMMRQHWQGRMFRNIAPRPLCFTVSSPEGTPITKDTSVQNSAEQQTEVDMPQKTNTDNSDGVVKNQPLPISPNAGLKTKCFIKIRPKMDDSVCGKIRVITNGNETTATNLTNMYDKFMQSIESMKGKVRLVMANEGRGKFGDQFRADNEFCLRTVREMQTSLRVESSST